jgi:hypothetical protein
VQSGANHDRRNHAKLPQHAGTRPAGDHLERARIETIRRTCGQRRDHRRPHCRDRCRGSGLWIVDDVDNKIRWRSRLPHRAADRSRQRRRVAALHGERTRALGVQLFVPHVAEHDVLHHLQRHDPALRQAGRGVASGDRVDRLQNDQAAAELLTAGTAVRHQLSAIATIAIAHMPRPVRCGALNRSCSTTRASATVTPG